jgi:hypothetical protein
MLRDLLMHYTHMLKPPKTIEARCTLKDDLTFMRWLWPNHVYEAMNEVFEKMKLWMREPAMELLKVFLITPDWRILHPTYILDYDYVEPYKIPITVSRTKSRLRPDLIWSPRSWEL